MAALMTPQSDQAYAVTGDTPMAQIGTSPMPTTHGLPTPPGSLAQVPPLIDSLAVLNSKTQNAAVGGAREGASMSLTQVLSGLQGEGELAEVLQDQPGLTQGE